MAVGAKLRQPVCCLPLLPTHAASVGHILLILLGRRPGRQARASRNGSSRNAFELKRRRARAHAAEARLAVLRLQAGARPGRHAGGGSP